MKQCGISTIRHHPREIDHAAGGKLHDKSAKEYWAIIEDLLLYDNESWNDPRDLAKPVKAISLAQDVLITSNCHLVELENQVQHLMEAHIAPKQSSQVNKISSSCEICGGPHDTQYCMENLEQAFVDYASSCIAEAGDARLSKFEADFKQQQIEMTNKIDTFLKVINDRMMRALPSNTIKNPKLNVNSTSLVSFARSYSMEDPQSSSNPFKSVNAMKTCFKSTNALAKDQQQIKTLIVDEIETPKRKELKKALEDDIKDLHLNLPVLEVLAHAPMYSVILYKYVESLELGKNGSAYIQSEMPKNIKDPRLFILPCKLKLLEDFYVIDMEKDPMCPFLVGREFLATASAIIDCKKSKIAVGEGITRLVFGVKEVEKGLEDVPY
ncbi:hypothetical protein Tco_0865424 [Tanacetum coccineum]